MANKSEYADFVINALVKSYREQLEDNGDLVASEFENSLNNLAKCTYNVDEDTIVMSQEDFDKVKDILPKEVKFDKPS